MMGAGTGKQTKGRIIAVCLLLYSCLFILDESPFTSLWSCLPEAQAEEVVCTENQEESLAIITIIKMHVRHAAPCRFCLPSNRAIKLIKNNASVQLHALLAADATQRDRSVNYCIFQI